MSTTTLPGGILQNAEERVQVHSPMAASAAVAAAPAV